MKNVDQASCIYRCDRRSNTGPFLCTAYACPNGATRHNNQLRDWAHPSCDEYIPSLISNKYPSFEWYAGHAYWDSQYSLRIAWMLSEVRPPKHRIFISHHRQRRKLPPARLGPQLSRRHTSHCHRLALHPIRMVRQHVPTNFNLCRRYRGNKHSSPKLIQKLKKRNSNATGQPRSAAAGHVVRVLSTHVL